MFSLIPRRRAAGFLKFPVCCTRSGLATVTILGIAAVFCSPATQASVVYGVPNSLYSQDFDTLANSGTPTWTNDSTIPGWYASRTTYSTGFSGLGPTGLHSMGSTGSTERALGSQGGSGGDVVYGVSFQNTTGGLLDTFSVSFVAEQWRNSGSTIKNTLVFKYRIEAVPQFVTQTGSETSVPTLNFESLHNNFGTLLDGNAPANRQALAETISGITWNPGDYLWLQWSDVNDPGSDQGMAIDDFSFTASGPAVAAVPEPSLTWLLTSIALVVVRVVKSRRQLELAR
ncbi:MAG: hypothetical protein KDA96_13595 [Planctomycetaceae bacterium]|nr:hypothetical protein [Planctomycetaceae bacterium]